MKVLENTVEKNEGFNQNYTHNQKLVNELNVRLSTALYEGSSKELKRHAKRNQVTR